jgi:hypothetical protein
MTRMDFSKKNKGEGWFAQAFFLACSMTNINSFSLHSKGKRLKIVARLLFFRIIAEIKIINKRFNRDDSF